MNNKTYDAIVIGSATRYSLIRFATPRGELAPIQRRGTVMLCSRSGIRCFGKARQKSYYSEQLSAGRPITVQGFVRREIRKPPLTSGMGTSAIYDDNIRIISRAGIPYRVIHFNTLAMLFRDAHAPLVDFYPGTGKWRIVGGPSKGMTFKGGAQAFLEWYKRHSNAVRRPQQSRSTKNASSGTSAQPDPTPPD